MGEIQKSLVYAIVPARSGSKGVKDKNIRLLSWHPMIAYSIVAAKLTPGIQRVIVSTDSAQYAEIAKKYGADVPFLRPETISGSDATDLEFMQHAIDWLERNEGTLPEYWVHLRPTTPLRDPQVIQRALDCMMADETSDSLRSAHPVEACPFKWFWKSDDGYYQTLNGISLDEANGPRQKFPQVFIPNGYVDILKTKYIMEHHLVHGKRMIAFESPKTIDVDHASDFSQLEQIVFNTNTENEVIKFLKKYGG